jgi:hypothetical protein
LLRGHAQNQHFMNQSGTICAELMLDAVEAHHCPPLPFRDRLPHLTSVDTLTCRVHRPRAPLRLLPIALERTTAPVLRLVDLVMRVQLGQRIATGRPQRNNPVAGFKPQGIVDLDSRHLRVERQIPRPPVMCA